MIRKVKVHIPFRLEGKHVEAGTEMLMEDVAYNAMKSRLRRGQPFIEVLQQDVTDPDEAPAPKPKRKPRAKPKAESDVAVSEE